MRRSAALLLLTGTFALACGRVERTRECRTLATTVNGGLSAIAQAADAEPAPKLSALADRYVELGERVDALSFQGDALTKAQKDYVTLLRDTAAALRTQEEASEKDAKAAEERTRKVLLQISRREKIMVSRFDSLCDSP